MRIYFIAILLFIFISTAQSKEAQPYIIPDRMVYHEDDVIRFTAVIFNHDILSASVQYRVSIIDHHSSTLLTQVFESIKSKFSGDIILPSQFISGKYYLTITNENSVSQAIPQAPIYLIHLKSPLQKINKGSATEKHYEELEKDLPTMVRVSDTLLHFFLPKTIKTQTQKEGIAVGLSIDERLRTTSLYNTALGFIPVPINSSDARVKLQVLDQSNAVVYTAHIAILEPKLSLSNVLNGSSEAKPFSSIEFSSLHDGFEKGVDVMCINQTLSHVYTKRIPSKDYSDQMIKSDLTGRITNLTNPQEIENRIVSVTSRGTTPYFGFTLTNAAGEFSIQELNLYGPNTILVQVIDNANTYQIEIITPTTSNEVLLDPEAYTDLIFADSSLLKILTLHKNFMKPEELKGKEVVNEVTPSRSYRVADYLNFENTLDFIKNVITLKRLSLTKKDSSLFLLNHQTKNYFKEQPLFIIDGVIISSFREIYELPLDQIEKINVITKENKNIDLYGRLGNFGVFSVVTKNNRNTQYKNTRIVPINGVIDADK